MVTGRIKWFGGSNNKTGKKNNFGFIELIESENVDDICVKRRDVPENLQILFEEDRDKGKGIYVEFDLDKNGQVINIKLTTLVGYIEWFNNGKGYIKCEGRSDVRISSDINFYADTIVYFGIRYNSKYEKDEAILHQVVDINPTTQIIQKCVESNNFRICDKFILQYIQHLSPSEAISFISQKLYRLNETEKLSLINRILPEFPEFFVLSCELREYLDIENYCNFIDKYLFLLDEAITGELWKELIKKVENSSPEEREFYWNKIKYLKINLKYKNYLWDIAPVQFQQTVIKEMFKEFFELIDDFEESSHACAKFISTDWKSLYNFDINENKLINTWCSKSSNKDFEMAKMMSARGAEKLVMDFYRKLGYEVEDISIHQVTGNSNDWILGDIRINSNILLDVKNARKDRNSDVYSEFCVSKLKESGGNDVKIAAVLSPYLKKGYMDQHESFPSYYKTPNNPQFLGTCTNKQIEDLLATFSDSFIRIDMLRNVDSNSYLPPWLFDYDEKFYVNQIAIIDKFKKLESSKIPTWEHLSILDQNIFKIFPLFIAAKRQVPQDYLEQLPQWKSDFINDLIALRVQRITLPHLFLAILKHFLTMLSYNKEDYSPQEYKETLGSYPLKIYDPLHLINELCDSLTSIWNHRNTGTLKLREFKIFKFSGRGLLQGQRFETDETTRLLAYCGGKITDDKGNYQGMCGHTPLVLGKHKTCLVCGYLICCKCDFCSKHCNTNAT